MANLCMAVPSIIPVLKCFYNQISKWKKGQILKRHKSYRQKRFRRKIAKMNQEKLSNPILLGISYGRGASKKLSRGPLKA